MKKAKRMAVWKVKAMLFECAAKLEAERRRASSQSSQQLQQLRIKK